jgi:hypothetical protein
MAEKHPKRPRDVNQFAKFMVDLATGSADEPDPNAGKDPAAVRMTPEQRADIARKAAKARWTK